MKSVGKVSNSKIFLMDTQVTTLRVDYQDKQYFKTLEKSDTDTLTYSKQIS